VLVIAPALGSRTARWTGDDHAYRDAEEHLEVTLEALDELRVEARGHVGAHDPLQAVEDGLREFPADEIVLAVHPAGRTNWLEEGVADDARSRYPCPVRVVTVGGGDGIEPG
jgi:nucleotide-binding universal stress UspA family protein